METSASNTFVQQTTGITAALQKIGRNVSSIQQTIRLLGTSRDTDTMRHDLHQLQHGTHDLVQRVNNDFKNLSAIPASANPVENKQRRLQTERLTTQFKQVLNRFQSLQKEAAVQEKQSTARARASFRSIHGSEASSSSADAQHRTQAQIEADELQELREREEAVRMIERDIVDVNHIFSELAILVHEQGDTIDSIDANIMTAQTQVEEGADQLKTAVVYQKKARKKMFILILLLLIGVIAVVLLIYFTTKK